MINQSVGRIEMYDASSFIFNKPDPSKTYDWAPESIENGELKVKCWNDWMRAFSYWMEYLFDFEISRGPGTSVGKIGPTDTVSSKNDAINDSPLIVDEMQFDNDWTYMDEQKELHGVYPVTSSLVWKLCRAPGPFRPRKITEDGVTKYYYISQEDYENGNFTQGWTGNWDYIDPDTNVKKYANGYDNENHRFDIVLSNSNFNNLGLRFKYPLTTTGLRYNPTGRYTSYTYSNDFNSSYRTNVFFNSPGIIPITKNENTLKQIAILTKTNNATKMLSALDFIDFIGWREQFFRLISIEGWCVVGDIRFYDNNYVYKDCNSIKTDGTIYTTETSNWDCGYDYKNSGQFYRNGASGRRSNIKIEYGVYSKPSDITDSSYSATSDFDMLDFDTLRSQGKITREPLSWSSELENHIQNYFSFGELGINSNILKFYKSYNNDTINIIVSGEDQIKKYELLIYQTDDSNSGLLTGNSGNTLYYGSTILSQSLRGTCSTWNSSSNYTYDNYRVVSKTNPISYGNLGGMAATSMGDFVIDPKKYYLDIRDPSNTSAIDSTGLWRIEKFCPISGKDTHCNNLYIVTRCGTNDLIGADGKEIIAKVDNKIKKFKVFPFNNKYEYEDNRNDISTLFAIPIEVIDNGD